MDLRPTFRLEESAPQQKESLTEEEAKTFFSTISFLDFKGDFHTMIETSDLSEERKEEVTTRLEKLYSRLEKGFEASTLKSQFIQTISVDPLNKSEHELLQYFLYSMKVLYDKFRITNPL